MKSSHACEVSEAFRALNPLEYLRQFAGDGIYPDGRPLQQSRPITVTDGAITSADASSLARVGQTAVLATVILEVATPLATAPEEGFLDVNVQLSPICSEKYSFSPDSTPALCLADFLTRAVDGSGMLDRTALCIEKGQCVWMLRVDVVCLDDAGNLWDAALVAIATALLNLRLPATRVAPRDAAGASGGAGGVQQRVTVSRRDSEASTLPLVCVPISLTFAMLDGALLVDPTADEEPLVDALFTLVVRSDDMRRLCLIRKPGGAPTTKATLQEALALLRGRGVPSALAALLDKVGGK